MVQVAVGSVLVVEQSATQPYTNAYDHPQHDHSPSLITPDTPHNPHADPPRPY